MGLGHWWCWRCRSLPVLGPDPSRPLTTNYTSHHAGCPVFYDPQASVAFFFPSRAFRLLKILNHSSPNSYFCLLVFPTRLSHWKPSVNDCLVSCSEERERLVEGTDEGREEEQEKPRTGNCTLCNLHCSLLKINNAKSFSAVVQLTALIWWVLISFSTGKSASPQSANQDGMRYVCQLNHEYASF